MISLKTLLRARNYVRSWIPLIGIVASIVGNLLTDWTPAKAITMITLLLSLCVFIDDSIDLTDDDREHNDESV
jgi:hypothetical protein